MEEYNSENHRIIHGDALEALGSTLIPDSSVDLIFADPPYNIGKNFNGLKDKWPSVDAYCEWFQQWLDLCLAKLKPSGSLYVMCATQCFARVDLILQDRLEILSRVVWHYDSSGVQAKKYFGSSLF
jgi:site-specific DNA-methyltransferase (adenine-specific)